MVALYNGVGCAASAIVHSLLLLVEFTEPSGMWSRKLPLIRSDSETQFLDDIGRVHLGRDAQRVLDGGGVRRAVGDHADALHPEQHRSALILRRQLRGQRPEVLEEDVAGGPGLVVRG